MILGYPNRNLFENPTLIVPGLSGEFFGHTWRVIGRALLGEDESGSIYYWNEYYLETEGQEIATLVYEETRRGGEWRWFTIFDPEHPLSPQEAAMKGEGDVVSLDGVEARVTLVRESQVYHTEGRTPEGVRPGARANYFNAEAGLAMLVVSWTGTEMEFYRGANLTANAVAAAFNVRLADLVKFRLTARSTLAPLIGIALGIAIFATLLIVLVSAVSQPAAPPPAVVRFNFAAPPLQVGSSGSLNGTIYRIAGHAEVEIAEVGHTMVRHEYFLQDNDGNDGLLIFGWKPGTNEWLLFTPLNVAVPMKPAQAGNVRPGQTVNLGGTAMRVAELFRSTVIRSDNLTEPDSYTGDVRYGFIAQSGADYVLTRWNEHGIVFWKGRLLQERDVTGPFTPPAEKPAAP